MRNRTAKIFTGINGIILFIGAFFVLIAASIYFLLGNQARDSLVEQMLHREQLSARASARSIEIFFGLLGKSVSLLAQGHGVEAGGNRREDALTSFRDKWLDTPVSGIVFADETGKVVFNASRDNFLDLGADLSDRDSFKWAMTARDGDINISEPVISRLGASEGKYVVIISSPVGSGERFEGVLLASVILEELSDQYLGHFQITENSFEYLISEEGEVIATNQKSAVGMNLFESLGKTPFTGSNVLSELLEKEIKKRDEGKLRAAFPISEDLVLEKMLIAYSPVVVEGNHLILAVATPEEDALLFLAPFYIRNMGVLSLMVLGFIVLAVRISKIAGYKEGQEVEHKLHASVKDH